MQNKENLEKLVNEGLSTTEIAKKIKLSQTCTRYWLKKYNLKTKPLFYLNCRKRYSDSSILEAWEKSDSVKNFFLNMGVNPSGGGWYHYQKRLKQLGIDIKQKTKDWHKKGGIKTARLRNEKAILHKKRLTRSCLKKSMDLANISYICTNCNLTEWKSQYIHLHIHHKDNNKTNNKIENLEYLCPNCHSQKHYKDNLAK